MSNLDKNRIAMNFSNAAKDYEQHAVLQKLVAERLLSRLDLMKLAPEWIVDIGSGVGISARALRKKYRGARVLQIDLSHAMLNFSRQKASRWFSGQFYSCADAESLPVATGRVDIIFSSLMLQWCNEPDCVFAEARRLLRTNGLFLFTTLGPETLRELRASWANIDNDEHVHSFFDLHLLGDALVGVGLEGVVMESEKITLNYQDCTRLMRDLKALGANNVVSSRRKALTGRDKMQRMMQAYENYRVAGSLPATYEIIYGHAWAPPVRTHLTQSGQAVFVPVASVKRTRKTG